MPTLPQSSSCSGGQPSGSQLPPSTHRAVHGGAGIPQCCRQLPALLLFSQCLLRLLSWCQPLASPTTPLTSGIAIPGKTQGVGWRQDPQHPYPARNLALVPTTKEEGWHAGPSRALLSPHCSWGACHDGDLSSRKHPGDGQQHIPSKGPGENECSVKVLLHVCVH